MKTIQTPKAAIATKAKVVKLTAIAGNEKTKANNSVSGEATVKAKIKSTEPTVAIHYI